MLTNVVNGMLDISDSFLKSVKADLPDYIDIETADSKHALVAKDGSLVTMIEVHGLSSLVGNNTLFANIVSPISNSLRSAMEKKGYQIQVWFEEDYDRAKEEIEKSQAAARETARRFDMDVGDVLDARAEKLAESVSSQKCFLVLWTRPSILNNAEHKIEGKQKAENVKDAPYGKNAQDPLKAVSLLRDRHNSFVGLVEGEMHDCGIKATILNVKNALREIRLRLAPNVTSENWVARIPGDKTNVSKRKQSFKKDDWEVVWPPMKWQLCPHGSEKIKSNIVKIGSRIYSPIYIDVFPQTPTYFGALLRDVRDKKIPWRISFLMEGGGISGNGVKRLLASLMGFANRGNKLFKESLESLRSYSEREGSIVQVRCALCTWAPADDVPLLQRRSSDLARSVEGWGAAQVSEVTGDPASGFMSSTLGATLGSIATKSIAPTVDFVGMMPWAQPASAWSAGTQLFKSPGGRLMPYQPYSDVQATWIGLFFAPPGSGKSVLMNASHFALSLGPGFERLPRIAVIDIGPSSSGFVSLVKESLPPEKRHLAVHKRLRMVKEDSINAFDTQLGCRFPTSVELQFLRNFVTLLATDIAADRPEKAMTGLVSNVVKEMYRYRSDKDEPNLYAKGIASVVDDTLQKASIEVDAKATWWEVVDALFEAGFIKEATIANRYAVPLLGDAVTAANSERVRNSYSNVTISTGENVIEAFSRMMREALDLIPILSRPTALDLGNARIASLDLDAVAKSGGDTSDRVTAVMYMLARQVLAKDFYLTKHDVSEMPAPPDIKLGAGVPIGKYETYHLKRAREIREDAKRICFDEFHRTAKSPIVRDQVVVDMREGRKWKVEIMLASQSLEDFTPKMIDFATSVYIMDASTEHSIKLIGEKFGFSDSAQKYHMKNSIRQPNPPTPGIFMAQFKTKSGKQYVNMLSLLLSPQEFWALSTDSDNVTLRDLLYERLTPAKARHALSIAYPYGAIREIASRKERMRESSGIMDEKEATRGIIDRLADEICKNFEWSKI